jgi:hypothetical protein
MSYIKSFRDRVQYNTSQAKQLMTQFVRRYRAGRAVTYQEQDPIPETPMGFESIEPEIYEGQMPEPPDYEPVQYDFLPEFHTPELRIEPPKPLEAEPNLEERIEDPQQEIQQAIDEIREPDNLDDLLRQNLFPPLF